MLYAYNVIRWKYRIKQLNEKGWKVYLNANNCGFCLAQIAYLANEAKNVNIVHCDDSKNIRECANLSALPTWKNATKVVQGARLSYASFDTLLK